MNKVLMFALGAAVGSLITWKLLEKKYKDLADEEIASVVERFKNREKEESNMLGDSEENTVWKDNPDTNVSDLSNKGKEKEAKVSWE